MGKTNIKWTFI